MEMANVEEVWLHWPPCNAHLIMLLPLQHHCFLCLLLEALLSTVLSHCPPQFTGCFIVLIHLCMWLSCFSFRLFSLSKASFAFHDRRKWSCCMSDVLQFWKPYHQAISFVTLFTSVKNLIMLCSLVFSSSVDYQQLALHVTDQLQVEYFWPLDGLYHSGPAKQLLVSRTGLMWIVLL